MMQSVSPDFVTLCIKLLSLVSLHGVNEHVRGKRACFYFRIQYSTCSKSAVEILEQDVNYVKG